MRQLFITKSVFLITLSMAVTSCMYNTEATGMNKTVALGGPEAVANNGGPVEAARPATALQTASGGPVGGYIEQYMDANDRSKMIRALDGGLGKSISWKNPVSGASFAVTPLRKVSSGEGICRAYSITMTKTGVTDKVGGTACIGDDGVWHAAG